jgi:pimeloyl-ACP methyl ester carboxylesterase
MAGKRIRGRRRSNFRTNVRLSLVRSTLGVLVRTSPSLAAIVGEWMFFTPPPPRRSSGLLALRDAEPITVVVDRRRVAAWRWGRGPAVALLHGWGGRAAQLTSFVEPLVARGFSVVALDAPGHGRSGRGRSSAPQFARALRAVAHAVGGLHGVVAHSLGAAAVALALRDGLRVARVVLLAAAAEPSSWVERFAARFGLPPHVVDEMRRRSERRIGMSWTELNVPGLARGFEAPVLLVHDRLDLEVPIADAAAIAAAWPGATLVETRGLGHNGLLRDPAVTARAAEFLAAAAARCACGAALESGAVCETCQVERELYDRELRWAAAVSA